LDNFYISPGCISHANKSTIKKVKNTFHNNSN
jgi:hypothetical protein